MQQTVAVDSAIATAFSIREALCRAKGPTRLSALRFTTRVGSRVPLPLTAGGKAARAARRRSRQERES